ncbi:hypothetical protein WB91_23270 [bacteria symbiont BFo1 of Frankliniella occidentalis]|uniref:DUF2570 domain-containing protein n=1 Tax=Erwinia aphidicola TaxID=68334 RepID=UPI0007A88D6F|nr:DUF2570 domain-containing protein [Erwinia aphidicola]KYP85628.1 hypothetical protein WB91_23270 [bacteria symbiont BFo1 of Frankliniella occidentalis]MCP2232866.1 prophage endopeptidase [Erwinia aphidicola]
MTWLATNWRVVLVAGLILLCVSMAKLASGYHARATSAEKSLASSEAITRNATAAINLMYDITKAANAERQSLQQKGETHVVYIREAVKGDECAVRDVPDAAADDLRLYADSIRAGAQAKAKP